MKNPFSTAKDVYQMQKELKDMEKNMKVQRYKGKSKKELVEIVIDGTQAIIDIKIDDILLSIDTKESLINNIKEAFINAQKSAQKAMSSTLDMDKIKSLLGK